jgi:hypothetical protein
VVVVITNPALVTSWRAGGLDAPDKALVDQHTECVVHRLSRDRANIVTNVFGDRVCRAVRPTPHRSQHSQALGRDLDAAVGKQRGWIPRHD